MDDNKPVRVNAKISETLNNWLDKRSNDTGISKSALIAFAIENYRTQTHSVEEMPELIRAAQMLEKIKRQVQE